jgi:hypothetical protein
MEIDTRPQDLIELESLDDTELRLRALACYVLRKPELSRIGIIALDRVNAKLANHVADLNRRISDGPK